MADEDILQIQSNDEDAAVEDTAVAIDGDAGQSEDAQEVSLYAAPDGQEVDDKNEVEQSGGAQEGGQEQAGANGAAAAGEEGKDEGGREGDSQPKDNTAAGASDKPPPSQGFVPQLVLSPPGCSRISQLVGCSLSSVPVTREPDQARPS